MALLDFANTQGNPLTPSAPDVYPRGTNRHHRDRGAEVSSSGADPQVSEVADSTVSMDAVVSLCARRGFIWQSSEIYGGINGFWDYGPLGAELKQNLKTRWWQRVVREREDVEGIDSSIIAHPRTWEASGHVEHFSDPMVDCRTCRRRFRADQLEGLACPEAPKQREVRDCDLTDARSFNLMLKTFIGASEDASAEAFLRAETCQSIFLDFKRVRESARQKLPFGIGQIGKAFRNEINPRNFTFRSREFEQAELEFFVAPKSGSNIGSRSVCASTTSLGFERNACGSDPTSPTSSHTTPGPRATSSFCSPSDGKRSKASTTAGTGTCGATPSSREKTSPTPTRPAKSAFTLA
jgi:glycyl-tRNA synthetase